MEAKVKNKDKIICCILAKNKALFSIMLLTILGIKMCPFEILHALPLALIGGSLLLMRYNLKRKLTCTAIILLSLIGLFSGHHVHTEHAVPFAIFDPCVGYIASLIISAFVLIKEVAKDKLAIQKQK